jgi:hypothetical protein
MGQVNACDWSADSVEGSSTIKLAYEGGNRRVQFLRRVDSKFYRSDLPETSRKAGVESFYVTPKAKYFLVFS